jgi:hypothetical protein
LIARTGRRLVAQDVDCDHQGERVHQFATRRRDKLALTASPNRDGGAWASLDVNIDLQGRVRRHKWVSTDELAHAFNKVATRARVAGIRELRCPRCGRGHRYTGRNRNEHRALHAITIPRVSRRPRDKLTDRPLRELTAATTRRLLQFHVALILLAAAGKHRLVIVER